jgi:hypothetical protein
MDRLEGKLVVLSPGTALDRILFHFSLPVMRPVIRLTRHPRSGWTTSGDLGPNSEAR